MMQQLSVTENQVLGAQIRAEEEFYVLKRRKAYKGGWLVPSRGQVYTHLSEMFGLSKHEISRYLTYSRSCTHPWKDGACLKCPK